MVPMKIKTNNIKSIRPFLDKLALPREKSHKGQNGKVLVIGGSTLFHSSPIWAAEIASHFADLVHFSSTAENNEIITSLKISFRDGMIIHQKDIPDYVAEDDAVLVGPGMVRSEIQNSNFKIQNFQDIFAIQDEGQYARELTHYLFFNFPEKRFVIDAGALQMIDTAWLQLLKQPAIITPHQFEFERLFGISVANLSSDEKKVQIKKAALENNCVILLKSIDDFISDGDTVIQVIGGNQGLTKGGTGDVLAGLVVSLYAKNDPIESAVIASFVLKKAAEKLSQSKGHWYNTSNLLEIIPDVLTELVYNKNA
ncbi:NAD(P)H-hydrate dehydratase [Candidatus Roizmanbacteria bacterium CG_4_10_14_0_2_um_filter_39_13]|uniref:ADP-dependent (S)-NAD(P)H-hydrate dehydratase n=1 Tax=Candidatus Roizmanbacteria bacterium CG_4_10_14_0_2_um_filter_39_13 TaxID=1974825 RepID=A0A2M7U163_9BACT|nr:MAG: NAD(P)H-hydrate dehydratase [Candidatus Roizmanbacteria bacterium CG_4_10_14_0_2_um_filter_39_13]